MCDVFAGIKLNFNGRPMDETQEFFESFSFFHELVCEDLALWEAAVGRGTVRNEWAPHLATHLSGAHFFLKLLRRAYAIRASGVILELNQELFELAEHYASVLQVRRHDA